MSLCKQEKVSINAFVLLYLFQRKFINSLKDIKQTCTSSEPHAHASTGSQAHRHYSYALRCPYEIQYLLNSIYVFVCVSVCT